MIESVSVMFNAYDSVMLEMAWNRLFERCTHVLKARGGNNFEVEHMGRGQRQRGGSW